MKRTIKHIAPWLAAAAVGATLVFAPVASAADTTNSGTDNANQVTPDAGASNGANFGGVLPYQDGGQVYQHAGAV
jgi:hypothetical protein